MPAPSGKLPCHEAIDQAGEFILDREDLAELFERPSPVHAEAVDAGNPQCSHRIRLQLRVEPTIALGFEDEVDDFSAADIEADQKIWGVAPRHPLDTIWHLELHA